jgi:hypothetical protein
LTGAAEAKAAGLSATAVLAALSAANATRLAAQPQPAMAGGDGILSAILRALVEGLVKGAVRQITPTKRRRRYSYTGDRRKRRTRRRTSTPGIDDIFRDILGRL